MTDVTWADMHHRPRTSARLLRSAADRRRVPSTPAVYAWYREGRPVYVGKADTLQRRVGNHMGQGRAMTNSAFRRNVAECLGIAPATAIKSRVHRCSAAEADRVNAWIRGCELAWIPCETPSDAVALESRLKAEFRPCLTKQ